MSTRPKNCSPAEGGRLTWPGRRRLHEADLGAEGRVELVRAEGAGVERAGDELPERGEVLEPRLAGVVVVRGGVVHVRGQPDGVGDAGGVDEAQEVGDLELAAERRPSSPLATASAPTFWLTSSQTIRPSGMSQAMTFQVAVEAASARFSQATCVGAEDAAGVGQVGLHAGAVRAAVGAQVEEEDVEHRAVGDLAVDPAGLGRTGSGSASSRGRRGRRGPRGARPTSRCSGRRRAGPSPATSC